MINLALSELEAAKLLITAIKKYIGLPGSVEQCGFRWEYTLCVDFLLCAISSRDGTHATLSFDRIGPFEEDFDAEHAIQAEIGLHESWEKTLIANDPDFLDNIKRLLNKYNDVSEIKSGWERQVPDEEDSWELYDKTDEV